MTIVTLLLFAFLLIGAFLGWGLTVLARKLRRMGAIQTIEVDPSTHQFEESWRRPSGSFINVVRGKLKGKAPILSENVWSHRTSGRKMVLVDGDKAVTVDVNKQELVWPTGYRIRQIINSEIPRKFDEESAFPWTTIAVIGLLAVGALVVMVGYVMTHMAKAGAH